ncbi:MAG: hypothetical protein J0J01_07595 [Reyranella sp.]|uniref:hypothetical protein n=1 Tax=Reyranella sp. TaxID=1929291 RepID=UPI001ACC6DC9|nr:hypothetical protein [Reyranella sp.]MBN9086755.1 hypothetical protein [Reyranella sp.]
MRALTALLVVMLPCAAMAQEQPAAQRPILRITGDYAGLTKEDRDSYCLWAGQLYSIGAAFCSRQPTLTTCTEVAGRRPAWIAKENDKFCDRNPSLTPQ